MDADGCLGHPRRLFAPPSARHPGDGHVAQQFEQRHRCRSARTRERHHAELRHQRRIRRHFAMGQETHHQAGLQRLDLPGRQLLRRRQSILRSGKSGFWQSAFCRRLLCHAMQSGVRPNVALARQQRQRLDRYGRRRPSVPKSLYGHPVLHHDAAEQCVPALHRKLAADATGQWSTGYEHSRAALYKYERQSRHAAQQQRYNDPVTPGAEVGPRTAADYDNGTSSQFLGQWVGSDTTPIPANPSAASRSPIPGKTPWPS